MPAVTPAFEARRLMRHAWRATLASALEDERGAWPYASLVLVACDVDICPLLLLSDLAVHTRNLKRDGRASILFDGTFGLAEPLTGPRLTVLGHAEPVRDERALDRYVRRHPSAAAYRGFSDFRLWRLVPERGQIVAGFGKIDWVQGDELRADPSAAEAIVQVEADLVRSLNQTAAATIETLGRRAKMLDRWTLTGIDPDGADLRRQGGALARVDFDAPVANADEARAALEAQAQ